MAGHGACLCVVMGHAFVMPRPETTRRSAEITARTYSRPAPVPAERARTDQANPPVAAVLRQLVSDIEREVQIIVGMKGAQHPDRGSARREIGGAGGGSGGQGQRQKAQPGAVDFLHLVE